MAWMAGVRRTLHGARRILHAARGPGFGGRRLLPLLVLGLAGCAGPKPEPADPAALTPGVLELAAAVPSAGWTARGTIDWRIEGRRGHGRVRMLLADRERVRVDVQPQGAFGLGGGRATLWADQAQVIWQEGNEPPRLVDADALFAPILGGRATGSDLALLLLGLSRLEARWPPPPWDTEPGDEPLLSALLPDGARELATLGGPPLVLKRLERRSAAQAVQFRARFSDFAPAGGANLPRQLDLEAPGQQNKLQVEWDAIQQGEVTEADLGWPEAASMR